MDADPKFVGQDPPGKSQSLAAPHIECAPLPMVEVEGKTHVVCFVNAAFCKLVQQPRGDLLGKPFADLVCNGSECIPLLDRVYETGEFETYMAADSSEVEPAHWLYAMWPALDQNDRPIRVIVQMSKAVGFRQNAVAMNEALLLGALRQHELREAAENANAGLLVEIVQRRSLEQALIEARTQLSTYASELERRVEQRTEELRSSVGELEMFSYSLVHDLRAPVRAIRGFTEMVLKMPGAKISPSAAKLLDRVVTAATRMDSLIQDVLSLSHVIRLPITPVPVNVDALVRTLVAELPSASAEICIESPLLPMLGHEGILSQCVTNLLGNALKFVEPGATPWIRMWSEEIVPQRNHAKITAGT
ncbi:MAG TPA: histidine kinase dimerization/phospho-acceptor domain-containing protein, partial [Opitutus sp.]|nr:histidine kinase dimerization/phospho-acceptor domain-containing protein [Opitutus sp.]